MVKISIIIPVYNTARTLRRCVESVRSQGYDDYELILVDDGSPDDAGELCDELARGDRHTMVIHQRNKGLSAARNSGLDEARGEYVTFIDSDDEMGPYTLPILMARLSAHPDYDLLEYPVCWHYGSSDQRLLKFGSKEYHDMDAYWHECKAYTHSYACNKIYRRELFRDLRYPEGVCFEDIHMLPLLLEHVNTIGMTEEGYYGYTYNPEGITATADGDMLNHQLDAHLRYLRQKSLLTTLSEYYTYVLNIQLDVYEATQEEPRLPVADDLSRRARRSIGVSRKMRRKLWLLQLFGMKGLCKINRFHHKLHRSH